VPPSPNVGGTTESPKVGKKKVRGTATPRVKPRRNDDDELGVIQVITEGLPPGWRKIIRSATFRDEQRRYAVIKTADGEVLS
jgi:hypothetical protein